VEVVLREDVDHVGLRGDIVNVARGYARNYLLPRGLAEPATPGLKRELERREALRARNEAKSSGEAEAIAKRIEATELTFEVNAGPSGSLFGSVTATNVVDKLWDEQKIRLDRRKLGMQTIKRIGRYTVDTEVFADVHAGLRILVVPEGGELPAEEPEVTEAPAEAAVAEAPATEPAVAEPAVVETIETAVDEAAADGGVAAAEAAADEIPAAEAVAEPAPEPVDEPTPEPVDEPAPEPVAELAAEPVAEAAADETAAAEPAAEDAPATPDDETA